MRTFNFANVGGGIALAVALALVGCAEPEPPKVVTVTPPVIAVTPPAAAASPTFQTRIGVAPLPGDRQIRLQSFAGDVCVADDQGGGFVSHCICAGTDCTCQGAAGSCKP